MNTVKTRPRAAQADDRGRRVADVLVGFGITGDPAEQMTFRSLSRLEGRGRLTVRIIGVAAPRRGSSLHERADVAGEGADGRAGGLAPRAARRP
jgi:hypothetical protein